MIMMPWKTIIIYFQITAIASISILAFLGSAPAWNVDLAGAGECGKSVQKEQNKTYLKF